MSQGKTAMVALVIGVALGFLIGHFVVKPGTFGPPAAGSPQAVVSQLMDALKAKDFDKVFAALEIPVPPAVIAMVKSALKNDEYFAWKVTGYQITDVSVDGGLAKITVRETHDKQFKGELAPAARYVKPGSNTVTETFYLIRDDGRWHIDPAFSGVNLATFPMKTMGDFQGVPPEDLAKKAGAWAGTLGFGQVFAMFSGTRSNTAALLPIAAAIAVPNFLRARTQAQYFTCQSNLRNIGTALEMYATDNGGRYPPTLKSLTPMYLKEIPSCSSAGRNTYSAGYTVTRNPDAFTVYCSGNNHSADGASTNYPQYSSTQGLIK